MTITGNEPAYAFTVNNGFSIQINEGLTIRQYFTAMAMQGMLSNPKLYEIAADTIIPNDMPEFYALCAVEHADALINQLNKQP